MSNKSDHISTTALTSRKDPGPTRWTRISVPTTSTAVLSTCKSGRNGSPTFAPTAPVWKVELLVTRRCLRWRRTARPDPWVRLVKGLQKYTTFPTSQQKNFTSLLKSCATWDGESFLQSSLIVCFAFSLGDYLLWWRASPLLARPLSERTKGIDYRLQCFRSSDLPMMAKPWNVPNGSQFKIVTSIHSAGVVIATEFEIELRARSDSAGLVCQQNSAADLRMDLPFQRGPTRSALKPILIRRKLFVQAWLHFAKSSLRTENGCEFESECTWLKLSCVYFSFHLIHGDGSCEALN